MPSAPESCDNCVSWQCAFWALVPFLLSVITQPCGQVCHFPLRLRTYLRCSPFVCAADNIGIIIHMALLMHAGCRPRKAARAVLMARRIENGVCEHTGQGLQSLEKTGLVRVLLFCLGTLPQVVKLMALSGIPWTKAWAGMYLGSFVTVEILLFMTEKQDEHAEDTSTANSSPHFRHLSSIETVLGICSIFIHLFVGAVACGQIVLEYTTSNKISLEHSKSWIITMVVLGITFSMAIPLSAMVLATKPGRREVPKWRMAFLSVLNCFVSPIIIYCYFKEAALAAFYEAVYLSCFFALLLVLFYLSYLSDRVQIDAFFLEHGLGLIRGSRRATDVMMSFSALVLFVGTFVLSMAWYSMCYDAVGTHKPKWVNALG